MPEEILDLMKRIVYNDNGWYSYAELYCRTTEPILYQPNRLSKVPHHLWHTDFNLQEQNMNRDFKGVWIPKEVYLDARLTALEKIILVEIDSLDNGEDGCFASNEYLAEFCQCTKVKVSTAISKLIELGYLDKAGFDGRRRILKSRLKLSLRQTQRNFNADIKKVNSNNIDNNKVKTNNIVRLIVDYLNKKAGTGYRPTSKITCKVIQARLNEGFTEDDFKAVIDKKVSQWKGTRMEEYLRPQTLFGTKFESYLNQNIIVEETKPKTHEPPKYKEFEPEPERDTCPMPTDMRSKYIRERRTEDERNR